MSVSLESCLEGTSPYWSSYIEALPGSRDTGDPLGFREAAKQIARKLVPDLTQRTRRTRGFTLLACGLDASLRGSDIGPTERFLRFETLIVATRVKAEGLDNLANCLLAGKRGAARLLNRSEFQIPLSQRILTRQLASGVWGTYRVAAEKLELLQRGGSRPSNSRLSKTGKEWVERISNSWSQSLKSNVTRAITNGEVDIDLLNALGKTIFGQGDQARKDEASLLTSAIKSVQGTDGPLHRLRQIYDANGATMLSVTDLGHHSSKLTDKQRTATTSASALLHLMEAIEQPFREGMTHQNAPPAIGLNTSQTSLWDDLMPSLDASAKANLMMLRKSVANGGFAAVLTHHQELSKQRGAAPWVRGELPDDLADYSPPDFTLSAASELFSEGVKP